MSSPSRVRALAHHYRGSGMARDCCFLDSAHSDPLYRTPPATAFKRGGMFALGTDTDLRCSWSAGEPIGPLADYPVLVGQCIPGLLATPDESDPPAVAALHAALEGHEVVYRSRHRGVELESLAGPRRGPAGDVTGTVTISIDVTRSESALLREQRAEERFRRLIDHSPALIGIRDADEQIVHANPSFFHTFAAEPGVPDDGSVPSPEGDGLDGTVRTVLQSGEPRVWEGRLPQPGGQDVHLLGHIFPLPLVDGTTGVGEVFLDLSPQDRVRGELAASEQRYRAIFDGAEICIILLDLDARIVDANSASKRLTGRSRSELRGRFVGAITTYADTEAHWHLWEEIRSGRRSRYDRPMTLRHADGTLHPAHLTMTLIRDEAGRPSGGLGLATPVSVEREPIKAPRGSDLMTGPQIDVLERLAAGDGLREIAEKLTLTRRGVDYRVAQLRRKLRLPGTGGTPATTAALVARAYALGILHPSIWPPTVIRTWRSDGDPAT